MSLNISKKTKLNILKKKNLNFSKTQLLNYIDFIYNTFLYFSDTTKIKFKKEQFITYSINYINPLLWQIGHVTFFYIDLILRYL